MALASTRASQHSLQHYGTGQYRQRLYWCLVVTVVMLLLLLSLLTGPGQFSAAATLRYLAGLGSGDDALLVMTVETLRLPRMLATIVVGAGMAMAASLLQNATRNPLAEPGLLGVNSGAVFLLVIGMTFFGVEAGYSYLLWAGAGALLGNTLVLGVAQLIGQQNPLRLILVGVGFSATLGGLANYLLMADQVALEQFRFWNLGSLSAAEMQTVVTVLPFFAVGLLLTLLLSRPLAVLQLGDEQAAALGINTAKVRVGVLLASTLFTGGAIAIAGPVAFVGFLAAYCARLCYPVQLSAQCLLSALFGIIFMALADILARTLIQPFELPGGVLLALCGAPVLIWVARRQTLSQLAGGH